MLAKGEATLLAFKENHVLEKISAGIGGLRAKIGGLAALGGFAFGPEYLRQDIARGKIQFRSAAVASLRQWYKLDFETDFPSFASDRLFANVYAVHHNYGGLNYYGPGPDSEKTGRSNYRLEDTAFDGTFGVKPVRNFRVAGQMGYLLNNAGPGSEKRYISSELIYSPAQAPGIDRQTDYLRYGGFAQFDYRSPSNRKGGNYFFQYSRYSDRKLSRYGFDRFHLELQQLIPFLNERRVIALRGTTTLTDALHGQVVPFYMRPTVGGSESLRGYRPLRFNGENAILTSAEYRWEVFSGLDMAIFADAGKVTPRRGQINFSNLESSVGVGFRVNARNQVFLRIDAAFSHEGFQVWFKFNPPFQTGPLKSSSAMGEF